MGTLLVGLLASCGGGSRANQPLVWHACQGGQCATLSVPLDYNKPNGKTIRLALFRIPARSPKQRIGALVFNPGGPGESGVAFLRNAETVVSDQLAARFDLVSWDPRGTGASDPVVCGPGFARALDLPLPVPATASQRAAADAAAISLDDACQERAGAILGHVATVDTARDLDHIRQALGEQRITYIGLSYGTFLGQIYATMFPRHVRAMVLDGVSNADLSPRNLLLAQAKSVERSLDEFLAYCAAQSSCAFHSRGHSASAFDALVARVHAKSLPVGDRLLGESQFWGGVLNPLYGDDKAALGKSLAAAAAGNGGPLLKAYDELNGRRPDGTYDETGQALTAINCDDGLSVGSPGAVTGLESEFRAAAPRAGLYELYGDLQCTYWPETPRPPQRPVRAQGAPPILVLGTTGDPVTPYENAVQVAHQLASGVLLTNKATGHTADAGLSGPCDPVVVPYLVRLAVPRSGTVCPQAG